MINIHCFIFDFRLETSLVESVVCVIWKPTLSGKNIEALFFSTQFAHFMFIYPIKLLNQLSTFLLYLIAPYLISSHLLEYDSIILLTQSRSTFLRCLSLFAMSWFDVIDCCCAMCVGCALCLCVELLESSLSFKRASVNTAELMSLLQS